MWAPHKIWMSLISGYESVLSVIQAAGEMPVRVIREWRISRRLYDVGRNLYGLYIRINTQDYRYYYQLILGGLWIQGVFVMLRHEYMIGPYEVRTPVYPGIWEDPSVYVRTGYKYLRTPCIWGRSLIKTIHLRAEMLALGTLSWSFSIAALHCAWMQVWVTECMGGWVVYGWQWMNLRMAEWMNLRLAYSRCLDRRKIRDIIIMYSEKVEKEPSRGIWCRRKSDLIYRRAPVKKDHGLYGGWYGLYGIHGLHGYIIRGFSFILGVTYRQISSKTFLLSEN